MSTPKGHPDFQDYAIWRGPLTVDSFQSLPAGTEYNLFPNLNCTNFNAILLSVSVSAGNGVTVTAGFAGGAVNTPSYFWVILPGQQLYVLLPAATNRFFLNIATNHTADAHFNLLVAPSNTPVSKPTYLNQDNSIHDVSHNLAANTATTYTLPYVQEGELEVMFQPQDTSGKLAFGANGLNVDTSQKYVGVFQFAQLVSFQSQTVRALFGPDPVQIQVQNGDAVNPHAYSITARMIAASRG